MEIRASKFLNSMMVIFLDKEDEQYKLLKPTFKKHGWAFKHDKNIFFDVPTLKKNNIYDEHNILFMEAHEVSHFIFNHKQTSPQNEAEADYGGTILCKSKKLTKSYKIGLRNFKQRNGVTFKEFHVKYGTRLYKYLNAHI